MFICILALFATTISAAPGAECSQPTTATSAAVAPIGTNPVSIAVNASEYRTKVDAEVRWYGAVYASDPRIQISVSGGGAKSVTSGTRAQATDSIQKLGTITTTGSIDRIDVTYIPASGAVLNGIALEDPRTQPKDARVVWVYFCEGNQSLGSYTTPIGVKVTINPGT